MKLQTEAQTEAQTEVQTEPPELFESWSESWSGSTESWSTESWSWSTEEAFTEQDYEALLCDREEVRRFRAALEPGLFWAVAGVGLAGNLLVLWVYLWRGRGLCGGRGLKALTHLYLLHLCVADLLFLLTLPLWAQQSTAGWTLGPALCKLTAATYKVSVGFFVPLVVMLGCYAVIGRRLLMTHSFHRHRPLLVVMTIVLVFIITQLPHNGALTAEIWDSQAASLSCEQRKLLDQTGLVLQALAFTHPALNPLLYALIGRRFRQEVMSLLPRSSTQKKKVFLSKPRPRTLSDSDTSQGLSL